jgi:hypothetical protein
MQVGFKTMVLSYSPTEKFHENLMMICVFIAILYKPWYFNTDFL